MGRRKNNPDLVDELIDGLWTMEQEEFDEKYASLSRSDMSKVAAAIDGMEAEFLGEDDVPACCSACGNPAYPDCMSSCSMFDD